MKYLIVIGKTTEELGEGKPIVTNTQMGGIEDFYTITRLEVENVLKGAIASNVIQVLQPAVFINESSKQSLLIREDYSLLEKNSSYLLFLAQVEGGGYSIISINQGKFSLNKTDQQEQVIEKENKQYATLKAKALSKYSNKILN